MTNQARAVAHAKAAARYRDAGKPHKAKAHFGRAEHYRSLHTQEFGGLWDMLSMSYKDENPATAGARWFCVECESTSTVIDATNSGEECVLPVCASRKSRNDATELFESSRESYRHFYKMACDNSHAMYALSSNVFALDDVPVTPLQLSGKCDGETPNPHGKFTPWVCTGCDRVRVIYRVWNDGQFCSNPTCKGKRADAVDAYKADQTGYNKKFYDSVKKHPSSKVLVYNNRLPTNRAQKARVLYDQRLGIDVGLMSQNRDGSRSISFLGEGTEKLVEMPLIIKTCIDELEKYIEGKPRTLKMSTTPLVEGLFRINPNAGALEKLKNTYLNGDSPVGPLEEAEPNAIASLLKWLLSDDVGGPLLAGAHETILSKESGYVAGTSNQQNLPPSYVKSVIGALPSGNKMVLRGILPFLAKVTRCKELRMPARNLAIVFAPLLIRPPYASQQPQDLAEELAKIERAIQLLSAIIDASDDQDFMKLFELLE